MRTAENRCFYWGFIWNLRKSFSLVFDFALVLSMSDFHRKYDSNRAILFPAFASICPVLGHTISDRSIHPIFYSNLRQLYELQCIRQVLLLAFCRLVFSLHQPIIPVQDTVA